MALTPSAMPSDPGAGAGGMTPGAGNGADTDAGSPEDNVICTICSDGQGGFTVFAGDEPEGDSGGDTGDMSEEDADAMGPAGDMPVGGAGGGMGGMGGGPQGQPASDPGAALRIVATILQSAGGPPGGPSADASFASGFGGAGAAGPSAAIAQKY